MTALLRPMTDRGAWLLGKQHAFVILHFRPSSGLNYWFLSMLFDEEVRVEGAIFDFRNRPSPSRRQDGIGWPPPCRIRKGVFAGEERGKKGTTAGLSHPPGRVSWVRACVLASVGTWVLSLWGSLVASQGRAGALALSLLSPRGMTTQPTQASARGRNAGTQERRNTKQRNAMRNRNAMQCHATQRNTTAKRNTPQRATPQRKQDRGT